MSRRGRLWGALLALWCALSFALTAHAESAEFERLDTEHYTVEWAPGLAPSARRVSETLEREHTRIYRELGAEAVGRTRVTVLESERDLLETARARHPGSAPPEWAAGLAYPGARAIYLRADVSAQELETTAVHELSHVAMGDLAGAGGVPTWFTEGVAVRQSEPFALDRATILTQAAMLDRLLRLDALERGFPAGGGRAGLAYAQSVHFVGWLVETRGAQPFAALMRTLGEQRSPNGGFEAAIEKVYGEPLAELERRWRDALSFWWGWMPIVFLSSGAWLGAAALLVYAWRRRTRERASRLRDMAGLEAVDMAEDIEIAHDLRARGDLLDPYSGRPPSIH